MGLTQFLGDSILVEGRYSPLLVGFHAIFRRLFLRAFLGPLVSLVGFSLSFLGLGGPGFHLSRLFNSFDSRFFRSLFLGGLITERLVSVEYTLSDFMRFFLISLSSSLLLNSFS